ncbi:MAG: NUDIX domain-containing protein [Anaerolineales bacterium]|nr:NUDIX domain-containing protein [Anaerolineales bacterium]
MPVSDQGATRERYLLVPRTAIFVRRGDEYLLIQGAPTKRLWARKYNGLGGHVERGEDALSAARRELDEEAGVRAELWLAGTVIVDAGEVGVLLFVFIGENVQGEIIGSKEGIPQWVKKEALSALPVVEDLPVLIERIHALKRGDAPFSARSYYDENGALKVIFEN